MGGFAACEVIAGVPTRRATRKSTVKNLINVIAIHLIVFLLSVLFLGVDEKAGSAGDEVVMMGNSLAASFPLSTCQFLPPTLRIEKRKN